MLKGFGRNPKDQHTTNQPKPNPQPSTQPLAQSAPAPANANYGGQPGYGGQGGYPNDPNMSSVASRAFTESEALAREIKDGTLNGFVGSGTLLTGEARFRGMLRIDGHLSGTVSSDGGTLIVSGGGQVDANVAVAVAIVNGVVNGDITATKRVELGRSARVVGNIQTPALVVENGAIFEGICQMRQFQEVQDRLREQERQAESASHASSPMASNPRTEEPAREPEAEAKKS